jgi:hypothetical protein
MKGSESTYVIKRGIKKEIKTMSRWQVTGLPGYKTQSAVENFYIFDSATNKTQSMSFRNIKFLRKK